MNKILVLYDSKSGNTAKMAALIGEGASSISGTETRLRSLDDVQAGDVLWCDGLAVGSPTNMGLLSWKMKRFWDEVMEEHWMSIDGKIACAFSSSGGWGGGTEIACQSILTVLINFGFLVFGVTDYAGKSSTGDSGKGEGGKGESGDSSKGGEGKESGGKDAKVSASLESLIQKIAHLSSAQKPQLRRIRFYGRFVDVHDVLEELAKGPVLAIPVGLSMKSTIHPDLREWTLLVWL